jgi:hypothetical protein
VSSKTLRAANSLAFSGECISESRVIGSSFREPVDDAAGDVASLGHVLGGDASGALSANQGLVAGAVLLDLAHGLGQRTHSTPRSSMLRRRMAKAISL